MSDIFGFDDLTFLSLSTLLCIRQAQQDPECHATSSTEENISSEDEGFNNENDSMTPHELSISRPKEKQLADFLDSVAETFSREKTSPGRHIRRRGNTKGKGAGQVTASGLAMKNQQPVVYIAKNEGTDEKDKTLAKLLTTWIQTIASTKRRPSIDKDIVWARLMDYYKQRLDIYATKIESFLEIELTAAFVEGSNAAFRAKELHRLSIEYKIDKLPIVLQRMVYMAYELRYEPRPVFLSPQSRKGRNAISFLGRLRASYEKFIETTIQFERSFSKLTIVCLPESKCLPFTRSEVEDRIGRLAKEHGIPKPTKKKIQDALGQSTDTKAYCHAEIQLLLHFEMHNSTDESIFPYLGCSKKSCWLCHQFLSRYKSRKTDRGDFYETRASHGRIYPLWHIAPPPDPRLQFYISSTLRDIQALINDKLTSVPRIHRPAQAESSANITVAGGAIRRNALAKQRRIQSSTESNGVKDEIAVLKDFVCSKECFRIPANGDTPDFLSINFYKCPSNYSGPECSTWYIPDFSTYWSSFNFERVHRILTLENQDPAELNGDYVLYWCRYDGLAPNRGLMSLLEITSLPIHEHFWYGDVFITRFHEDSSTYKFRCEDVPRAFLSCKKLLTNLMRRYWERKEPEDDISRWQHLNATREKTNADKQIILGRMSESERQVLKEMPEMLEYLAITACDDGAVLDSSIRESKDDPEMMEISLLRRRTAMEQRGWKGFSTDDL